MLKKSLLVVAVTTALAMVAGVANAAGPVRDKWCKDVKLRVFVGGAEGDSFGSIGYNGA